MLRTFNRAFDGQSLAKENVTAINPHELGQEPADLCFLPCVKLLIPVTACLSMESDWLSAQRHVFAQLR